jgi:hypothetical protein
MRLIRRLALPVALASLVAACSNKNAATDDNAPLSFVPADTPYAMANLEPVPQAVYDAWSQRMKSYWPTMMQMYQGMLDQASAAKSDPNAQRGIKIAKALLEEFTTDDPVGRIRSMGFKPDARYAFYGVGMVPVIRTELGDPAALKAEIAKIEAKVGEKVPTAKVGNQDIWFLGDQKAMAVAAIEGNQLVLSILPVNADDSLKQTILGLTKPAQNLGSAGALQAIGKQYGYSNYGVGFVDFVKLTERLSSPPTGTDAQFAKALDIPFAGADPACKADYLEIAHKFPRFVGGVEEMTAQRVRLGAQMEIDTSIAAPLAAALTAAPGTGAPGDGVFDMSLSLPVLKLKDFWIKQADAVAAKPYTCPQLISMNQGFADSKAKVDVTVPPPFSDFTGVRFVLDKLDMKPGSPVPDIFAKLAMRTSNPGAVLAMAQLAVPQLATIKVAPDGKSVSLPSGTVPMATQPIAVAMTSDTIGISSGAGEDAALGAFIAQPPAKDPVFMRFHFTGQFYKLMGDLMDKAAAAMPPDKQQQFAAQKQMFAAYEQMFKYGDVTLTATPTGIAFHEIVEQN